MLKRTVSPVAMVVFGASGDLTRRKLLPALYSLQQQGLLPAQFAFIGYARTANSDEGYRDFAKASLMEFSPDAYNETTWQQFAGKLFYVSGNYDSVEHFHALAKRIQELRTQLNIPSSALFYLSTPPNVYLPITTMLHEVGLIHQDAQPEHGGWCRLIIEKPFGHDLASARALNRHLLGLFSEDQIFRIDHYLGKETVQNLLVFRFANGIFEPVWNRNYIDHIQITVAESLDIGERGGYYDKSGALRDMMQNHLLQLVTLIAMEPPVNFAAKAVRDQKVNALAAIRPLAPIDVADWVVRAQYTAGDINGKPVKGYKEVEQVDPNSTTDTYVAWKLEIDNWRWNGVPFYLRTGKALANKLSEVNIVFRKPPQMLFHDADQDFDSFHSTPSNVLTLRLQPDESIFLSFGAKKPGPAVDVDRVRMEFSYTDSFGAKTPDAYERLLLDALAGDSTLFIRADETELAWDRITHILNGWSMLEEQALTKGRYVRLPTYAVGSWGPAEADLLLAKDKRYWRNNL